MLNERIKQLKLRVALRKLFKVHGFSGCSCVLTLELPQAIRPIPGVGSGGGSCIVMILVVPIHITLSCK